MSLEIRLMRNSTNMGRVPRLRDEQREKIKSLYEEVTAEAGFGKPQHLENLKQSVQRDSKEMGFGFLLQKSMFVLLFENLFQSNLYTNVNFFSKKPYLKCSIFQITEIRNIFLKSQDELIPHFQHPIGCIAEERARKAELPGPLVDFSAAAVPKFDKSLFQQGFLLKAFLRARDNNFPRRENKRRRSTNGQRRGRERVAWRNGRRGQDSLHQEGYSVLGSATEVSHGKTRGFALALSSKPVLALCILLGKLSKLQFNSKGILGNGGTGQSAQLPQLQGNSPILNCHRVTDSVA